MKNIRFYRAAKYATDQYEEVEANIYKTYVAHEESDDSLSLHGVNDEALSEKLRNADGWEKGKREVEEFYLILIYNGKKYYKQIDDEEEIIYEDMYDCSTPELTYVTSIVFEQEPEFDENEPSDEYISQYPLEDILDEFCCEIGDFYKKENAADPVNSYIEFASSDIEDIRNLLNIVGKHVYDKDDGEYVNLIIE